MKRNYYYELQYLVDQFGRPGRDRLQITGTHFAVVSVICKFKEVEFSTVISAVSKVVQNFDLQIA